MAATAMDPVDIANILAQELLYQQVTLHIADSIEYIRFCFFIFHAAWHEIIFPNFSFLLSKEKKNNNNSRTLLHRKIVVITLILTIIYHKYTYNLSITLKHIFRFFLFTTKLKRQCH